MLKHTSLSIGGMRFVESDEIERLYKLHMTSPVHARCGGRLRMEVHMEKMQFYFRGTHQKLSPWFRDVVDRYWTKFSQDCMDAVWVVGVVPVTWLVLRDGTVVPQVLHPGTYRIATYYDSLASQQCFLVYRTLATGASLIVGKRGNEAAHNPGGSALGFEGSRDLSEPNPDAGATSADSRANMTRRMDLGTHFPTINEPDRTCTVLSGFGHDVLLDGTLTSIVAASARLSVRQDIYESVHLLQEQQLAMRIPFLESEAPSAAFINSHIWGRRPRRGVEQSVDNNGETYERSADQIVFNQAMERVISEQNQDVLRSTGVGDLRGIAGTGNIAQAMDSAGRMARYAENAVGAMAQRPAYLTLPPGGHISETRVAMGGANYQYQTDRYEQEVCTLYELPIALFRNLATTQGNVEMQSTYLNATKHKWNMLLTQIMTQVYNLIYAEVDGVWEMSYLLESLLRPKLVARLLQQLAVADTETRAVLAERVSRRLDVDIDAVTAPRVRAVTYTPVEATPSVRRSARAKKRTPASTTVTGSTVSVVDERAAAAAALVEAAVPHTMTEIMEEPDNELADYGIELMFRKALERAATGSISQLFIDGTEGQKQWLAKARRDTMNEVEHIVSRYANVGQGQTDAVIVTFTSVSALPPELLLQMRVFNTIDKHEYTMQMRQRANLPAQCDDMDKEDPVDRFRDLLASSYLQQALANSGPGMLLTAGVQALERGLEEAVGKALEEEKGRSAMALAVNSAKASATPKSGGAKKPASKRKATTQSAGGEDRSKKQAV